MVTRRFVRVALRSPALHVAPGEIGGDAHLLGAEDRVDLARAQQVGHRLPVHRQEGVAPVHPRVGRRAAREGLGEAQLGVGRPLVGEAEADELAVGVEGVARGLGRDVAEARVERPVAHGLEVGLGRGEGARVGVRQLLVPVVVRLQRVAHERALPDGRAARGRGARRCPTRWARSPRPRRRGRARRAAAQRDDGSRGHSSGHRTLLLPVCGLRRSFRNRWRPGRRPVTPSTRR